MLPEIVNSILINVNKRFCYAVLYLPDISTLTKTLTILKLN
jgi:hypothetical protein